MLGAFGYSTNVTQLHRDESVLPARRRGRASWNYRLEGCGTVTDRSRVSYWMNRLQGHPESDPLVVTLNPDDGRRAVARHRHDDLPAPDLHRRVGGRAAPAGRR